MVALHTGISSRAVGNRPANQSRRQDRRWRWLPFFLCYFGPRFSECNWKRNNLKENEPKGGYVDSTVNYQRELITVGWRHGKTRGTVTETWSAVTMTFTHCYASGTCTRCWIHFHMHVVWISFLTEYRAEIHFLPMTYWLVYKIILAKSLPGLSSCDPVWFSDRTLKSKTN